MAIALLNVPQVATPEITDYCYVVRDATDLSYKLNSYVWVIAQQPKM